MEYSSLAVALYGITKPMKIPIIASLSILMENCGSRKKRTISRLLSHHEGYTEEALRAKQCEFGILVLKTSLEDSLERIYELYKERADRADV